MCTLFCSLCSVVNFVVQFYFRARENKFRILLYCKYIANNFLQRYVHFPILAFSCIEFLPCFFPTCFFFFFTNIHHSQNSKGNGDVIFLTPLYHFHPLHRHLDISLAITGGNSLLHRVSGRTRIGNYCFLRASCEPLSKGPFYHENSKYSGILIK